MILIDVLKEKILKFKILIISPVILLLSLLDFIIRMLIPLVIIFTLGSDPEALWWQKMYLGPYRMFEWIFDIGQAFFNNEGVRDFTSSVIGDAVTIITQFTVNIYEGTWTIIAIALVPYMVLKLVYWTTYSIKCKRLDNCIKVRKIKSEITQKQQENS